MFVPLLPKAIDLPMDGPCLSGFTEVRWRTNPATWPTNRDFKGGWTLGNIDSESSFITQIVNSKTVLSSVSGISTYFLQWPTAWSSL